MGIVANRASLRTLIGVLLLSSICMGGERPKWVQGYPEVPGEISSLARGEHKLDAVVKALNEITLKNEAIVKSLTRELAGEASGRTETVQESRATLKIGGVNIESVTQQVLETTMEGQEIVRFHQDVCKIVLQKNDVALYEIQYFYEKTNQDVEEILSMLEEAGGDSNFSDLMLELKDSGLQMYTYDDVDVYYVLVRFPVAKE